MANNHHQAPFWEFVQSFGPNGQAQSFGSNGPTGGAGIGVDHANSGPQFPPGFPFHGAQFNPWTGYGWGPWAGTWGHPGWHNRADHRGDRDVHNSDREDNRDEHETESSPDTMRPTPDDSVSGDVPPAPLSGDLPHRPPPPGAFPHPPPPPPQGVPNQAPPPPPFQHGPFRRPFGHHRGRGGRGGRGARHGPHPPPPAFDWPFDFRPLMNSFANHPFAQALRDYVDQARTNRSNESNEQQDDTFVPPVDVFNTEGAYVLHVSLPGALKEDVGVSWDGEKVNIAGVVHRPGNEEFLQSLVSSERTIGMFERSIKLPPAGGDDKEIDGLNITAKMENGILIVTVPKTEKDWTEIHKVDIQ
ncbi:hypothetical protein AAE478_000159 [Parahypoxylon ruwenzoriense]